MKPFVVVIFAIFVGGWLASNATAQSSDQLQKMRSIRRGMRPPIELDSQKIDARGIAKSQSRHLTLLTDVRGREDIAEFCKVFDSAVGQWCDYFEVSKKRVEPWHLRGMVIADRERFDQAGLLPDDLPDFLAGYQQGHEMWVYLQPGQYYSRHLLLHEGTHSFMQWFLGGTGAAWYSEGMAELLGVHSWNGEELEMNFQLADRSQAPYWGRVKLVQENCRDGNAMSLDDVFAIPGSAFREVRYYAWSWAACHFFSQHPRTKPIFRKLKNVASKSPTVFNAAWERWIHEFRPELDRDWELFVHEIEFGYDFAAGVISPAEENGSTVNVKSDSSWQLTSIAVKPGETFAFKADGQYTIATEGSTTWTCEAGGITIDYYAGHPLGQLMVAVLPENAREPGLLLEKKPVGTRRDISFDQTGRLAFRINESPAKMSDNEGKLTLKYKKLK